MKVKKPDYDLNMWRVRGVPTPARLPFRRYAISRGMTTGEAIIEIGKNLHKLEKAMKRPNG